MKNGASIPMFSKIYHSVDTPVLMKAAIADYFWENGGYLAGEALGNVIETEDDSNINEVFDESAAKTLFVRSWGNFIFFYYIKIHI